MRKILTTAVVVAEIVAVSAGAAFASQPMIQTTTSKQTMMQTDNVWARNGAAAVAIQEDFERQSNDHGN